jgi:hypothetical protein
MPSVTPVAASHDQPDLRDERVRERRLRRLAHRHGLVLEKSPSRNPSMPDFSGFQVCNARTRVVAAGELGSPLAMSLDAVERYLTEDEGVRGLRREPAEAPGTGRSYAARQGMSTSQPDPMDCPHCQGTGWRKKYLTPHHPPEWSECRAYLATGRQDQRGPKKPKPGT